MAARGACRPARRLAPAVLAAALAALLAARAAAAQAECQAGADAIVADVSSHEITVDARFAGTEVLVFGTRECAGDVVVTVRGPRRQIVVREKTKAAGIWVNGRAVTFADAPVLYGVAATAPLEEILPAPVRQARSIGVDELYLPADRSPADLDRFRGALVHYQQQRSLYSEQTLPIDFVGGKLFRASIWFPASVPTGEYVADAYLIRDKAVAATHSQVFRVYRGGFEARLYDIAHEEPALYGAAAVLAAVAVGWAVGMLFQRP